jgi:hypothetical protein
MPRDCCACGEALFKRAFSANQWSKGDGASRCKSCVVPTPAIRPATAPATTATATAYRPPCLEVVCRLAARARLSEIGRNKASKVISFTNGSVRFNYYYTTGTVGTCLDHPKQAKTQLFRREQDARGIEGIFANPRVHTGDGYQRKTQAEKQKLRAAPAQVTRGGGGGESRRPSPELGHAPPDFAFFYPNRSHVIPAKMLCDGYGAPCCKVVATHDAGARCFERRHFVDFDFLQKCAGGHALIDSMVSPVPACDRVMGTKTESGQVVCGMLAHPLTVELELGSDNWVIALEMDRVLVVDSLPVPLHISVKAFPCVNEGGGSKYDIPNLDTFLPLLNRRDELRVDKALWPRPYRDHPFWTRTDLMMLGCGAPDKWAAYLEKHSGSNSYMQILKPPQRSKPSLLDRRKAHDAGGAAPLRKSRKSRK